VYDMYPWADPADTDSAEPADAGPAEPGDSALLRQVPAPRHVPPGSRYVPAAAVRAVQVALDRRDNGGDAVAAADQPGASQPGPSQPRASQPGASQPGPSQPGASQPRASQPPASRTRQ
jgi:hypothetical protein